MKAELISKDRFNVTENSFVEIVIWRVPAPLMGSFHHYKYRLAFIENDICILRYDNEAGKGDHKHYGKREFDYHFIGLDELRRDFMADVRKLTK